MLHSGLTRAFERYRTSLARRSEAIPRSLERLTGAMTIAWAGVFLAFASLRIVASPRFAGDPADWLGVLAPYAAIALAPLAGFALAEASYPRDARLSPPGVRLSAWGRWRKLAVAEARAHPLFGPAGFMASLLVGLLLNVVLRSLDFLIAMPALSAQAPEWSRELFLLMAGGVGMMAFFYMVAFAFALHSVALFPSMLAFCWLLDVLLQLVIAQRIGMMEGLPDAVAASLGEVLNGNVVKVLISALIWAPYLIISKRVNLTYRWRVREDSRAGGQREDDEHS